MAEVKGYVTHDFEELLEGIVAALDVTKFHKAWAETLDKLIADANEIAASGAPKPPKPSIITCPGPSCGKENDAGVKSCWWCGGKL